MIEEKVEKKTEEKPTSAEATADKKAASAEASLDPKGREEKKEAPKSAPKSAPKGKKKIRREVLKGKVYIKATFNNTIVSITDMAGNVLCWASAGTIGLKGTRKSTPYAASQIAREAAERARDFGMEEAEVYVKGVGSGRESAVRAIDSAGLKVSFIQDRTPLPHNGPRPKKTRRV